MVLAAFFISSVFAGSFGFGVSNIKSDPIQNRIYWGINKKGKGVFSESGKLETEAVNYTIYDPTSGKKKLIFPDSFSSTISDIFFECYYDSLKHRMVMSNENGTDEQDYYFRNTGKNVINNLNMPPRTPADKLLFIINPKGGHVGVREIWTCKKDGSELKKIDSFNEIDDYWHVDLLNKKIRLIIQNDKDPQIKEYEW
jgi:hypothetical protein